MSRVVIHFYRAGQGALCRAGARFGSRVLRANSNPDRVTCLTCIKRLQAARG